MNLSVMPQPCLPVPEFVEFFISFLQLKLQCEAGLLKWFTSDIQKNMILYCRHAVEAVLPQKHL